MAKPGLLVLYSTEGETLAATEPKLVTEIALAVDQYTIIPVLTDRSFVDWSYDRQQKMLRELARTHHASYSLWVTHPPSGSTVLFLCTLLPRRTFLRTVEVQSDADVEKDIAVAARELLEEIGFSISPPAEASSSPTEESIEKPTENLTVEPRRSFFEIMFLARGTFGVTGQVGPVITPGTGIGFKWCPPPRLYLKTAIALDFGPYKRSSEETISGIAVAPEIGLGYLKQWGLFSLGPLLEFQESWTRLKMSAPAGGTQTYSWWQFRIGLGVDARLSIRQKSAIMLNASLGLSPVQQTIRRDSDASTRFITSLLDIRVAVSIAPRKFVSR